MAAMKAMKKACATCSTNRDDKFRFRPLPCSWKKEKNTDFPLCSKREKKCKASN